MGLKIYIASAAIWLLSIRIAGAQLTILWGANGHFDQGGPYSNISISQQARDLHKIFGPGTVLYRAVGGPARAQASQTQQLQSAGIEPLVGLVTYPKWASFANETSCYDWAYSTSAAIVKATPTAKYYEIGNEWTINGLTNTGNGSQPTDWSSDPYFRMAVAVTAGAVAAIRDNNPSAKTIGGATNGWTDLGLPVAMAQALQNYNGRNLTWDYTVLHWYNGFGDGMGMPDNFNGGMNAYTILKAAGKPLFITEFGASNGNNPANDPQAGSNLTALMNNFQQHAATTPTEPGIAGATIYQLYQQPSVQTDYALYNYSSGPKGTTAPQGQAVQNWIAANGSSSGSAACDSEPNYRDGYANTGCVARRSQSYDRRNSSRR